MPEHNFEQQARDMANGFNIEPKPEVWQNVRNAIGAPKRKRRVALWWWLLPLALVVGGAAFYMTSKTNNTKRLTTINAVHQKATDGATNPAKQLPMQQVESAKEKSKENKVATVVLSPNNTVNKRKRKAAKAPVERTAEEKQNEKAVGDAMVKPEEKNAIDAVAGNEKKQQPATLSYPCEDKMEQVHDKATVAIAHKGLEARDSIQLSAATQDSTSSASTIKRETSAIKAPDSSGITHTIAANSNKTKIQWGIVAEGGIAAKKSFLFSLAGSEKSSNNFSAVPGINDPGSGWGQSGTSGFRYNSHIKYGAAFALGVALQKKGRNNIDFFADMAYHYQSFSVTTTAYSDSLVLNNAITSIAGSYQATQAFHIASLFAGVNWHFIKTSGIQLGVSAGVDNMFLIAAVQKVGGISSRSNASLAYAARRSDSAFTAGNFNKYQPGLFAGVLIDVKTGNRQLQLVPFVRSSISPFDKSSTGSNNHLFSGGLRAVYYFK